MTDDVPGHFLSRAVALGTLHRVTLVSPWVSLESGRAMSLATALSVFVRRGVKVLLLSRPPADSNPWHSAAVESLSAVPGARVYLHPSLHAKFFVAEARTGTYAVIGSANLTVQGSTGREVGVALAGRSWGEEIIRDLLLLSQRLRHDEEAWAVHVEGGRG